jgi:hypothetical protein
MLWSCQSMPNDTAAAPRRASDGLLSVTYRFRNTSTADSGLHVVIAFWLGYGGQIGLCSQLPRARLQTPLRFIHPPKHLDGMGLVLTHSRQWTRMLLLCCRLDGETRQLTAELQVGNVSRSSFRPMPSRWRSTVLARQARVQPATVTMGGERHVAEMMPHSCHPSIQRIDQYRSCCYELTTRSGPRADSPRRPHNCLLFHKCRMCRMYRGIAVAAASNSTVVPFLSSRYKKDVSDFPSNCLATQFTTSLALLFRSSTALCPTPSIDLASHLQTR